jgi:hypothetical protein
MLLHAQCSSNPARTRANRTNRVRAEIFALPDARSPIRSLALTYGFPFLPVAPELCEGGISSGQTKPF